MTDEHHGVLSQEESMHCTLAATAATVLIDELPPSFLSFRSDLRRPDVVMLAAAVRARNADAEPFDTNGREDRYAVLSSGRMSANGKTSSRRPSSLTISNLAVAMSSKFTSLKSEM